MLKWLKNAWPWSSKNPDDAIWPKDFKVEDVKKALDKQAPKPTLKKATTRSKTMPLRKGTSDITRNKNIAKEVKQGKPVKQAVAIGYAVQGEAIAKKGGKAAAKSTSKGKK